MCVGVCVWGWLRAGLSCLLIWRLSHRAPSSPRRGDGGVGSTGLRVCYLQFSAALVRYVLCMKCVGTDPCPSTPCAPEQLHPSQLCQCELTVPWQQGSKQLWHRPPTKQESTYDKPPVATSHGPRCVLSGAGETLCVCVSASIKHGDG